MHLPDVNFWLALTFQSHKHHASAQAWMGKAPIQSCCICRWTQIGFLRLATNRQVLPLDALRMTEAWQAYDELLSDERVVFVAEPDDIEPAWRSLTHLQTFSPKVWNDAYLAAFAQVADLEIVTFDKGFVKYKNLRCTILT